MASYYDFTPTSTPPPQYWAVIQERPPVPPKSGRRMSNSRGGYEQLMPTSCIPSVPPRHFTLQPCDASTYDHDTYAIPTYRIPRKPLPLLPQAALSPAPLSPPPSLSSPSLAPTSPTPSLRSLSSTNSTSSAITPPSTPARYRHRVPVPNRRISSAPTSGPATAPTAALTAMATPLQPTTPPPSPPRALRRTTSAQTADLRALRAMESEACLRAAYENQLNAYLDGSIMLGAFGMAALGVVDE